MNMAKTKLELINLTMVKLGKYEFGRKIRFSVFFVAFVSF